MNRLIPGFTIPLDYPTSDGKPMAETDTHRRLMFDLIHRLQQYYATQPTVYVTGNLMVYYSEGHPQRHLSPDCFVAFGVPNHERDLYKTWLEGVVPSVVFEITSKSTKREDIVTKRAIYEKEWKVDEYFLFDPFEDYLDPSLQGFRRVRNELRPIKPVKDRLLSRTLGITLERDQERLVLREAESGELLLTDYEQEVLDAKLARDFARKDATRVRAHADQLAAENERLLAELAALKKKKS
jgi:Uma2 family endonuclease